MSEMRRGFTKEDVGREFVVAVGARELFHVFEVGTRVRCIQFWGADRCEFEGNSDGRTVTQTLYPAYVRAPSPEGSQGRVEPGGRWKFKRPHSMCSACDSSPRPFTAIKRYDGRYDCVCECSETFTIGPYIENVATRLDASPEASRGRFPPEHGDRWKGPCGVEWMFTGDETFGDHRAVALGQGDAWFSSRHFTDGTLTFVRYGSTPAESVGSARGGLAEVRHPVKQEAGNVSQITEASRQQEGEPVPTYENGFRVFHEAPPRAEAICSSCGRSFDPDGKERLFYVGSDHKRPETFLMSACVTCGRRSALHRIASAPQPLQPTPPPAPKPSEVKPRQPRTRATYESLMAEERARDGVPSLPVCPACEKPAELGVEGHCADCDLLADIGVAQHMKMEGLLTPATADPPPWRPSVSDWDMLPDSGEFGEALTGGGGS